MKWNKFFVVVENRKKNFREENMIAIKKNIDATLLEEKSPINELII